ncbi:hypothetical protein ABW16_01845 [Mycolicibacter heraklionensis]|uniref:Uncharacterized protein n=1 Tax=Mycolicibacter heraklionensis TaxID=512402 RepID=A0ABR5FLP4_9MYCO|nr:hypothetical protein [Mycolicibacter heraklionensis]KLO31900.1 hypothetical protein ABW16_01845 [Mycolicibacter heraklionensis]
MSDPAVEAARRAWKGRQIPMPPDLIVAAREALTPIRELHRPFTRDYLGGDGRTVCDHCLGPVDWPCLTARFAYASEELP